MTIRNLGKMFRPESVAVIGAGTRPQSVGWVLMQNILHGGFAGAIMPVNPKHKAIGGIIAYPDVASLPVVPDLAILCIGPEQIPGVIADLGKRGTCAAVIITAGFAEIQTPEGRALEQALLDASKPTNLRIIGPNCVGIQVPGAKLNASFAHMQAQPGGLAFVSQSGAICTSVLDDVSGRGIGFSHFISLGNSADVDFGDMLDYLAGDAGTTAILLYIESVKQVRKFMSAARAASRLKPVVVIKSGRNSAGAKAAASHTGALIGSDAVYDVAFRRAGMLRVLSLEELFDAVETLSRLATLAFTDGGDRHDRLLIVTNGGGPAVLATDHLIAQGGTLAELRKETVDKLNAVLPPTWSHHNPVDIIGDADRKRYGDAMRITLAAEDADAVFVMKCPTAISSNEEAAEAVTAAVKEHHAGKPARPKMVFTSWLGEATVQRSRQMFAEAGIPTYETPEKAVQAFVHMVNYRRSQALLMEIPPATCPGFTPDAQAVRAIIAKALAEGRKDLSEPEAKQVFAAYGIPVVKTVSVASPAEAAKAAAQIGFPVALKIISPDISHKSDVGGVMLGLKSAEEVSAAASAMLAHIPKLRPQAKLTGFSVQQMADTRQGYELIVGMSTDAQFGPVLMFGEGGVGVEVIDDKALGLPPLNTLLAAEMIRATRVWRRLQGFRDRKPVDMDALAQVLVQVSMLVTDMPEIAEIDINPLVADEHRVIALDGRVRITQASQSARQRLAISAYPEDLEEKMTMKSGSEAMLRPVRPEDAHALQDMLSRLSAHDLYHRFRGEIPVLTAPHIARLTHIDYDREMVFVATPGNDDPCCAPSEILASLVCTTRPTSSAAEFTLAVRTDCKQQGLGHALTEKIIRYVKTRPAIDTLFGYVLPGNTPLLSMVKDFGFMVEESAEIAEGGQKLLKVNLNLKG